MHSCTRGYLDVEPLHWLFATTAQCISSVLEFTAGLSTAGAGSTSPAHVRLGDAWYHLYIRDAKRGDLSDVCMVKTSPPRLLARLPRLPGGFRTPPVSSVSEMLHISMKIRSLPL